MATWIEPAEKLGLTFQGRHEICCHARRLAGVRADVPLDGLSPKDYHTTEVLNAKLQSLHDTIEDHPTDVLRAWLAETRIWRPSMPAWTLLRDAAARQCTGRNSPEFTEQMFFDLLEP